ncbi:TIGR03621 family F420-dependent LLM class oxidoreductase [Amycolatopsis jiangsuensis]|uniref:Putative F420-dependent oxidoreductase n=1 Tax=Amycolatopsis jiangsuensis TaxID=1181879 RepID=A0A840J4F8_9PSEU|nr:TIGR03621 family F420-dependent LLM class oxidoreductase [Amycolatopsis jiangsuensis]MBB4688214.1 putative F420-dependent oxidoreductase [Amycolatopsis jiangsuensis]
MTSRPLRFGLCMVGPIPQMKEEARRAEQTGFDVVLLSDHLGMPAPLPPLISIAEAAPSLRVGNMVINASFYRPALLARDLASVDSATGGRLEIGLGTGYVEEEFHAAGLPFPSAGARVDLVVEHAVEIRRLLSSSDYNPAPAQTPPPIMIAGIGDRMLAAAAQHADIVAFPGMATRDHLTERVTFFKDKAGDRSADIELAFSFFQVGIDDPNDLSVLRFLAPGVSDDKLRTLTAYLPGPVEAAADRIRSLHEVLGITYFTFNLTPTVKWETLEKLVAALK